MAPRLAHVHPYGHVGLARCLSVLVRPPCPSAEMRKARLMPHQGPYPDSHLQ